MFTPTHLRRIALAVLIAFGNLVAQPVIAAANLPEAPKARSESAEEKHGRQLEALRERLDQAEGKRQRGEDDRADIEAIMAQGDALEAEEGDAETGFADVEAHLRSHNLPPEILTRHQTAVTEYRSKRDEFKRRLHDLKANKNDPAQRDQKLKDLADYMQAEQKHKRHTPSDPNKLPFRTPDNTIRPPIETEAGFKNSLFKPHPIRLAANGSLSNITLPSTTLPAQPNAADLAETEDIQLTPAIQAKAQELGNNPVKIHNWVRNSIEFIPSYGSIQGSELTLQAKRGNAFDTASLEIALLRAAGIPARYVYGTIQLPADQVMNWVGGVSKPEAAQSLLGQGGIPNVAVVSGGKTAAFRMEHVWVEAYVDYLPSRGAVNRQGDTWVPLDASVKQYSKLPSLIPPDLISNVQGLASTYTQSATRSPDGAWSTGFDVGLLTTQLDNARIKVTTVLAEHPDTTTLDEIVGGWKIVESNPSILMGTLPYGVIATGAKFVDIPSNLRVGAQIQLYSSGPAGEEGALLFNKVISFATLGYGSLNLTHTPATPNDAATWDSYKNSGAASLPAYLIQVKSQLKLNGQPIAESPAIQMGQDLILKVAFQGAGHDKNAVFRIVSGDELEVGLNGAGLTPEQGLALAQRTDLGTAAGNMSVLAKVYWTQQDFQERIFAQLQGIKTVRLPSAGIFALPLTVSYWYGIPRLGSYHSRQVDIKLSHSAVVALNGEASAARAFVTHAGMVGSATEGAAVEETFGKPLGHGSNTMRLLQLANEQKIPIYQLTPANFTMHRAELQHPSEVMSDITNAINAGLEVTIPKTQQTNGSWTGSGYIMRDPVTGSADYRVNGLSGNFDEDVCQRAVEPIKVAIPDVALIWWLIFGWMVDDDFNFNGAGIATALVQIAMVTALVGIVAPVAMVAIGVVTRGTLTGLFLFFSGSAMAEDEAEQCNCIPRELGYRRGGNPIHDNCANRDEHTDPEYKGTDVQLGNVAFDGFRKSQLPSTFYEVKTGKFYSVIKGFSETRPSSKKFLDVLKMKAIIGYYREREQAAICGFEFNYSASDGSLRGDMIEFFNENVPAEASRVISNGC